jgi:selenophosphate synthetase-related protein
MKTFKSIVLLAVLALTLTSCMKKDEVVIDLGAKDGDIVLVHYTLSGED